MKTTLALLISLGLMATLAGQPVPPGKAKAAPGTKATPGAKAAPAGKDGKEEEEPKIEGMEVPRSTGGFLGIQVVAGTFKITFYDKEKKPVAPDVARAVLRWDAKYKVGREQIVLNPGEPNTLSSPRPVRPPYNFKLFITLLKDAANDGAETPVGESFVVDFRQ